MDKINIVKPYKAFVTQEILDKWNGVVRVWSEPKSAVDGAEVVDLIKRPIEVTIVEEQKDIYDSKVQRLKIHYEGDKGGWVISDAIAIR